MKGKIYPLTDLLKQLAVWRKEEKKIVFTNGCFDILHLGHIDYLSRAADAGNVLIIGVNSDNSVRRLKGSGRPINNQQARTTVLAALQFVDAVVIFDEDTPYELIKALQPDVLVKGKDYQVEEIAGHDIVLSRGGQVITIALTQGYSTTDLIKKLTDHRKQDG
ncbi:MAG: D-glycero-beta-D-manno-heptose 1-phosphate adenylyltransferase [Bacteroidales bacterium]|nr:D-glycero-beta-D-manno-heptose 1-phosphate adenylyltransferase [Bacteroidales bacterium]MDZ4203968.1 D-glycero-beta-D-manno-heptose 1-phosphate adenylyltransferase [Bacteroidales bacterium]